MTNEFFIHLFVKKKKEFSDGQWKTENKKTSPTCFFCFFTGLNEEIKLLGCQKYWQWVFEIWIQNDNSLIIKKIKSPKIVTLKTFQISSFKAKLLGLTIPPCQINFISEIFHNFDIFGVGANNSRSKNDQNQPDLTYLSVILPLLTSSSFGPSSVHH